MLCFGSSLCFPSPEKLLILRQKEWKMRVHQQLLFMLDTGLLVHVPMSQEFPCVRSLSGICRGVFGARVFVAMCVISCMYQG